jgi:hypothetical protein
MERGSSLPHSQEFATCYCPEPVQSSPFSHPTSLMSIVIWSSHLRHGLPSDLFPSDFHIKTLFAPHLSPIRATVPVHIMFLQFIIRMIFGEDWSSQSSSMCSLLHSPAAAYKSRYFGKIWNRHICSCQLRQCFLFWKRAQEQRASKGRKAFLRLNEVKCTYM